MLPWRLRGRESTCHAGDAGNLGAIPGWGRSPGGRQGNPLQYACLENSMTRGAWQVTYSPLDDNESDMTEAIEHATIVSHCYQNI